MSNFTPSAPSGSRDQLRLNAEGLLAETVSQAVGSAAQAFATGVVYGGLVGLRAGDVVTGVAMATSVAGSGTAPTTIRVGICNSAGVVLATSGNVAATAFQAIGVASIPLSAPFTVPTTGAYFLVYIIVGAWGTTQATLLRMSAPPAGLSALAGNAPQGFSWAGQADLPAVGSSVVLTTFTNFFWYMAAAGSGGS